MWLTGPQVCFRPWGAHFDKTTKRPTKRQNDRQNDKTTDKLTNFRSSSLCWSLCRFVGRFVVLPVVLSFCRSLCCFVGGFVVFQSRCRAVRSFRAKVQPGPHQLPSSPPKVSFVAKAKRRDPPPRHEEQIPSFPLPSVPLPDIPLLKLLPAGYQWLAGTRCPQGALIFQI